MAGTAVWHPLNNIRLATSASNAALLVARGMRQKNIPPRSGIIARAMKPRPERNKAAFDLAAVIFSSDEVAAPFTTCTTLGVKAQDSVAGRFWHVS